MKSAHDTGQTVAVVGLGYVGLPLSMLAAGKNYEVIGIDVDSNKIAVLNNGTSYLPGVSGEAVRSSIEKGKLRATTNFECLREALAIIICVPTPLNESGKPELRFLQSAVAEIAARLQKNQIVILESSTYPGTTKEVLLPLFESAGWKAGRDFYLGYSPERVDPGNETFRLQDIPKVISGVTPHCLERIKTLYADLFGTVVPVSSTEAAEMTKLLENSFRFVNISFINEMAMICDKLGLDLWEIIDAASTKPFGYAPFYPGPGVGGHCIPVDPAYLQWRIGREKMTSLYIKLSESINKRMSRYIADRLNKVLNANGDFSEKRILLYGITYKRNIPDTRESTAIDLFLLLRKMGADVFYHDPLVPEIRLEGDLVKSAEIDEATLHACDCVVIATDHAQIPLDRLVKCAPIVFDTRNATKRIKNAKALIYKLGGGDA